MRKQFPWFEEEDNVLTYTAVGAMVLVLGTLNLVVFSATSQLLSWIMVFGGALFIVSASTTRYGDFGGFQDLG
jgi:hypothetical protein